MNVSALWGFSPNAFQTRTIAIWDNPTAWAMPRVLQWVAVLGFSSRVLVTISSTIASVIVRRGAGSRLVGQPVEAVFQEALPPLADGGDVDAESGGDVFVVSALGTSQDDPRSGGQPLGALGSTGPGVELLSFVVAEDQRGFGATAFAHHRSPLENYMMNQAIYQGCLANF